ncbi:hypothetical protein T492DRAFT_839812 [Pavlovales sp. CCMP2436]|nr:hypothetical protein T492DRAFT_839812 [Pavlovales sp. CCMP2436]
MPPSYVLSGGVGVGGALLALKRVCVLAPAAFAPCVNNRRAELRAELCTRATEVASEALAAAENDYYTSCVGCVGYAVDGDGGGALVAVGGAGGGVGSCGDVVLLLHMLQGIKKKKKKKGAYDRHAETSGEGEAVALHVAADVAHAVLVA